MLRHATKSLDDVKELVKSLVPKSEEKLPYHSEQPSSSLPFFTSLPPVAPELKLNKHTKGPKGNVGRKGHFMAEYSRFKYNTQQDEHLEEIITEPF